MTLKKTEHERLFGLMAKRRKKKAKLTKAGALPSAFQINLNDIDKEVKKLLDREDIIGW